MKAKKAYKKGGKFPDLTGDGKVTQADILKGRKVFKMGGKMKTYKKGGMAGLSGLQVTDLKFLNTLGRWQE